MLVFPQLGIDNMVYYLLASTSNARSDALPQVVLIRE